jgi:hypothetical protein
MSKRARVPARALVVAAALAASTAAEAGPSRVAVVRDPSAEGVLNEFTTRLQAELQAAGFEVIFVDGTPDIDPSAQVAGVIGASPPFATVAVVRSEQGAVADVWVADRTSGKSIVHRIDVSSADLGAPRVLAIRAVELLRASLVDLREASPTPAPAPMLARIPVPVGAPPALPPSSAPAGAAPPSSPRALPGSPSNSPLPGASARPPDGEATRPPDPGDRPRPLFEGVTVQASLAALITFGDLGESLAPGIRVGYGSEQGWLGRIGFVGPKASISLEGAAGGASVREELALVELVYAFGSRDSVLLPTLSIGAGIHHAAIEGTASPPYVANDDDAWAAAADAGAGLALRAGGRIAFVFDVHTLILLPEPLVFVAGEEVGRAGTPAWLASLGVLLKL